MTLPLEFYHYLFFTPIHLLSFETKINAYEFILISISCVLRCDLPVFDCVKVDF